MPDWDEILTRDGPAVWRTAYRIVGNRADADECFQEAFLAALEISRRGPVRHWCALLQRLAAARAVDRLRSRIRRGRHESVADWDALGGPAPLPSKAVEDAELSGQLREAIARIPPKQAEAFCLHALEGWSYREIAEHMDATTDSVGVLVHRARMRLRQLLAGAPGISQAIRHSEDPGSSRREELS
ncbi:MAG: RNA polymerase sigma factor [Isosphaeraceae bacterium]